MQPAILPAYASSGARMLPGGPSGGHVRHPGGATMDPPRRRHRALLGRAALRRARAASSASSGPRLRVRRGRSSGSGTGPGSTRPLDWALAAGRRAGRVTTTIFPGARPADVWDFGVDSLPASFPLAPGGPVRRAPRGEPRGPSSARRSARFATERSLDPATGPRPDGSPLLDPSRHRRHQLQRLCQRDGSPSSKRRAPGATGWFAVPFAPGAADRLVDAFWRGDRFGEGPRGTPEDTTS